MADNDLQKVKTDVAVIKANQANFNKSFEDFKITTATGQQNIIERIDKFSYAPISLVDNLELFKTEIRENYVKKEDGKLGRTVRDSVLIALAIAVATTIYNLVAGVSK